MRLSFLLVLCLCCLALAKAQRKSSPSLGSRTPPTGGSPSEGAVCRTARCRTARCRTARCRTGYKSVYVGGSGAVSHVPETVEVNDEPYAKDHCCLLTTYEGSAYQLYGTLAKPADVKKYGCLDNCIFQETEGQFICISSEGTECTDASVDFTTYTKQAAENREKFLNVLATKTIEYGNLNEINLTKKLEYIRQDILNAQDSEGERPHPILLSKQEKYTYSKMPKFEKNCTPQEVDQYMDNLERIFEQHQDDSQESLINSLIPFKEELKNNNQGNYHQVSHFLIQNTRMVSKITKPENQGGDNGIPRFWQAVLNNTDQADTVEYTRSGGCDSSALTGALGSTATGCLAGPEGCAAGAITGGVSAVTACAGDAVKAITSGCFAATSLVETMSGLKKMSELVIGDFVRTSSPTQGLGTHFTEFLGWLDREMSAFTEMLQVSTSQGYSTLTLTGSHNVYSGNNFKYAAELKPGDTLNHWNGSHIVKQEVTEIMKTYTFGSLSPLTREGTLLVDGYLASSYASFPHQFADLAMIPVKAMPRYLLENEESQNKDGVRTVVKIIKKTGELLGLRKKKKEANKFPSSSIERTANFWQFLSKIEF